MCARSRNTNKKVWQSFNSSHFNSFVALHREKKIIFTMLVCIECQEFSEPKYVQILNSNATLCFECYIDKLIEHNARLPSIRESENLFNLEFIDLDLNVISEAHIQIIDLQIPENEAYRLFAQYLFFQITAFIPRENDPRFQFERVIKLYENFPLSEFYSRYETFPEKYQISWDNPFNWLEQILVWANCVPQIRQFFKDAIQANLLILAKEEICGKLREFMGDEMYWENENDDDEQINVFEHIPIEVIEHFGNEDLCPICLETFNQGDLGKRLPCGHLFCVEDLDRLGKGKWNCPCPCCRFMISIL